MAIPDLKDNEVGTTSVVFRDVLFLTLACFLIIIVLLLPHIAIDEEKEKQEDPPGTVIVEISWAPDTHTDIDLWVKSPNDVQPIGYSNQNGKGFNLLRDDLGSSNDPLPENYENAYARGLADGEYIVNVHAYSDRDKALPLEVYCAVRLKGNHSSTKIANKIVILQRLYQEITVFRFVLKDGKLFGLVYDVPIKLRSLALD